MRGEFTTMVTEEEREEIILLVGELSKLCNARIPIILEEKNLDNLKKFNISMLDVSLQFGCDEDVYNELKSRRENQKGENLTYFG